MTARENLTTTAGNRILSRNEWKIIILSSLGGALEFYDFVIFGVFAQYIGEAFFSTLGSVMQLVLSFAVFAIGYLSRPVGGVVLSWFGDRYGRRRVFIASIIAVSFSTIGMGLVPTYAVWGAAATGIMLLLRLIQGFCLGGELPGAITYVVETAPERAGFVCGVVFFFVSVGVVLAALVNLVLHSVLSPAAIASYGWRIAFIIGGVIGLLAFWLRRKLEETPEFAHMKGKAAKHPTAELLKEHGPAVLLGILITAATAAYNGLLFAQMPSYLAKLLHYDGHTVAVAQNVALATMSVGVLIAGWLGDIIPRRLIIRVGALLMALLTIPFYLALQGHHVNLIFLMFLCGLPGGLINGTFACVIADLFPTRVRYSGVALAYNVSFTIFSGTAPLVVTWLISHTGHDISPGYFMAGCAVLTFLGTFKLKSMSGRIAAPA